MEWSAYDWLDSYLKFWTNILMLTIINTSDVSPSSCSKGRNMFSENCLFKNGEKISNTHLVYKKNVKLMSKILY